MQAVNMSGFLLIGILHLALGVSGLGDFPHLQILPSGVQDIRRGRNLVLTCRAAAVNLELVRDLRWYSPNGNLIPQDERIYSEEQPGEASTALFIKHIEADDGGVYSCKATYAANQQITAEVKISVYVGITWDDAPVLQYAKLNQNYKIRCKVRAEPPANIDWFKGSSVIVSGSRFVIESDGMVVQGVRKEDGGVYTCRARVPETGELEERDIQLEVEEPPVWVVEPGDQVGIEQDKAVFQCRAVGSPSPRYSWVGPNGEDVTAKDGWKQTENEGILTAYQVYGKDRGMYKCIAENNAGRIESTFKFEVIIRPRVQELYNATYKVGDERAELRCIASGHPLPNILWRKWSKNEPYVSGLQPGDPRIMILEAIVEAPPYTTEGETEWKESTLIINSVERTDDGLYECQTTNQGGSYFKSGHITVEFAPTFEHQVVKKEWSWDQKEVNLTCLATSIPNATISWWYNKEIEIGRDDKDLNYRIIGRGPQSSLNIIPLSNKYFREYVCRAENPLGVAEYTIELEEARVPGTVNQAKLERQSATSLVFKFVPPVYVGGVPIDSYAVEYKEARSEWTQAKRRVWPAAEDGEYIVEGLYPFTTYDLRFSCRNRVGFSPWGATTQITTPNRGAPDKPLINRGLDIEGGEIVIAPGPNNYILSWRMPQDNGVLIDYYRIISALIRKDGETGWTTVGKSQQNEVPNRGTVSYTLENLYQNSYYNISVEAHNEIGFSPRDFILIRTKPGEDDPGSMSVYEPTSQLYLGPILGIVLLVVLLLLLLIDLSCWKFNYAGVSYTLSRRIKFCRKFDMKRGSSKSATRGQKIINNTHSSSGQVASVAESSVKTAWAYAKSTEDLRTQPDTAGRSREIRSNTRFRGENTEECSENQNLLPEKDEGRRRSQGFLLEQGQITPRGKFTSEWVLSETHRETFVPNIYDVTPDHSILKNGLAKSLSQMCILESEENNKNLPNTKMAPNLKQANTATLRGNCKARLVKVGPPTLPKPNITSRPNSEFMSGAVLSNTRANQMFRDSGKDPEHINQSPDWVFYAKGRKTKDFGDFQIFSDSPLRK